MLKTPGKDYVIFDGQPIARRDGFQSVFVHRHIRRVRNADCSNQEFHWSTAASWRLAATGILT